jgi:hypothetical protein
VRVFCTILLQRCASPFKPRAWTDTRVFFYLRETEIFLLPLMNPRWTTLRRRIRMFCLYQKKGKMMELPGLCETCQRLVILLPVGLSSGPWLRILHRLYCQHKGCTRSTHTRHPFKRVPCKMHQRDVISAINSCSKALWLCFAVTSNRKSPGDANRTHADCCVVRSAVLLMIAWYVRSSHHL